jgi:hypothetical protein
MHLSTGQFRFLSADGRLAEITFADQAARVSINSSVTSRDSLSVDANIVWSSVKNTRADHVYLALLPVPYGSLEEFDAWFIEEHGPMVSRAQNWASAMLCTSLSRLYSRIGVHLLDDLAALDSEERRLAGLTPWTQEVMAAEWSAGIQRFVGSRHEAPM